ncbi:hypothetical protein Q7P37_000182 [Cladosporium fusiforme]
MSDQHPGSGGSASNSFSSLPSNEDADLSQRLRHRTPESAVAENRVSQAVLKPNFTDLLASDESKPNSDDYPWWVVERWNRHAAYTTWGLYLPLEGESNIANVIWMGYRWSIEDKLRYVATGDLPLKFRQGDVSPGTPILLIRAMSIRECRSRWASEIPTRVRNLDKGPFPCLFYVDCGGYAMRHVERSGLLFPSEFVDNDHLNQGYSGHLGQEVSSGQEFLQKYPRDKGYSPLQAKENLAYLTNLERCLRAPWAGFQVRAGKDFDSSVVNFFLAQLKDEKPITWYTYGKIVAKDCYVLCARDLWLETKKQVITNGITETLDGLELSTAPKTRKSDINESGEDRELDLAGDEVWWKPSGKKKRATAVETTDEKA